MTVLYSPEVLVIDLYFNAQMTLTRSFLRITVGIIDVYEGEVVSLIMPKPLMAH